MKESTTLKYINSLFLIKTLMIIVIIIISLYFTLRSLGTFYNRVENTDIAYFFSKYCKNS